MAEAATLARPYARAAFEYARAQGALEAWGAFFRRMAELVATAPVRDLISSPEASRAERAKLLAELAPRALPEGGENLLHLMADHGRLALLPTVEEEFGRLRSRAETTASAVVETAIALDEAAARRLTDAVSERLGRKVEANFRVAPEIIGGAIVRVGDQVIDASLATRLMRLARAMAA